MKNVHAKTQKCNYRNVKGKKSLSGNVAVTNYFFKRSQ